MPLPEEQSSPEMEAAVKAFKDWRSNREKLCRIPEHLWKVAAKLSPQYPISTICENLGLNWGALKKKIDHFSLSTNTNHPVKSSKQPSFLELKLKSPELAPSLFLNDSASSSPRCAIELTKADGTVMRIFASNDAPINLLELFQSFLGTGRETQ